MLAVIVTGPPGAGKTVTLTALSDALVDDGVAHAAVDVDDIAWAYPFADLARRCEHLRAWCEPHRRAGHDVVLVAEVIESSAHLLDVVAAVGTEEHLLVRLDAAPATLRRRIIAREPPGWSGLDRLLDETPRLQQGLAALGGVHLAISSEETALPAIVDQIRSARPGELGRAAALGAEQPRLRGSGRIVSRAEMDLVVAVPAFLDLTAVGLEGLPALGEEKFAGDLVRSPGGGAITAVAAARLGLRTALVAPLGDDVPGQFVRAELEREGIRVAGAPIPRMPQTVVLPCGTDRAMVTIDPGARARQSDVQAQLPAGAVACNLEQLHLVPDGTPMYLTCGSDDARAYAGRLPQATRRAGGLFVDGPDACLLAATDGAEAAGATLAAAVRTVVVTRGAAPALAWHDGEALPTTEYSPGRAVDTTGDVDLLCASFAWAELRGAEPRVAVEWARLHAALATTVATATAGAVDEARLLDEGRRRGLVAPGG